MLVAFQLIQLLLAIWMWTLIGRGALALLAGKTREQLKIYRLLGWVVAPPLWLTRRLAPRVIVDAHIPWLTLLLVLAARVGVYMLFYQQGWLQVAA